ncbi:MAG: CHAT domain-containing protein [Deltaproteobacteria bacterium]|nr:CHAT domain-containing protein [Deltaproteobacteria bacterium]
MKRLVLALALLAAASWPARAWETPAWYPQPVTPAPDDATSTRLKKELLDAQAAGKLLSASEIATELLRHDERRFGKDDPRIEKALDDAARLASAVGDYVRAEERYSRLHELAAKVHGAGSENAAQALELVGIERWIRGDHEGAEQKLVAALELREAMMPPDEPTLAMRLITLASFFQNRGQYARAEHLYERALGIHERATGAESSPVAGVMVSLGFLHQARQDWARAEEAFKRAIAIYAKQAGPNDTSVPAFSAVLAELYHASGREADAEAAWARSEAGYREYLAAQEAAYPAGSPMVQAALRLLAGQVQRRGRLDEARGMLERVLAAEEAQYGPGAAASMGTLMTLAQIDMDQGRWDEARKRYEAVLARQKVVWGPTHSLGSESVLVTIDEAQGEWEQAARRMEGVLKGYEAAYGEENPLIAANRMRLGILRWAQHRLGDAVTLVGRSEAVVEPQLRTLLAVGTEQDRRTVLAQHAWQTDVAVSLGADPEAPPAAAELGLRLVLRRKGRLLDAMANTMGTLRKKLSPADREALDDLGAARSQLAKLVTQGAPPAGEEALRKKRLLELSDTIRRLEVQIAARSVEYRVQTAEVTVAGVRAQLPEATALVEIVAYRQADPLRGSTRAVTDARRYAAFVLPHSGPVRRVELGPAEPIEKAVSAFREALADPDRDDVKRLGRALDRLTMAPIRQALGSLRAVLIAPDGALNLVPFAALVDEHGRYLLEDYAMSYLTSGRDLLRMKVHVKPSGVPLIFAAPDFEGEGAEQTPPVPEGPVPPTRGRLARGLGARAWGAIPGTAQEASALAAVLKDARVRTGSAATEAALKGSAAPPLLHVATHGFFLPATDAAGGADADNPLLRSGLVLAGANHLVSGPDDGVLTALEASGLDLWGTRLVVLSACETGVGEVSSGDGVYGLRRALVMAGSESQLLSLWQVDDEATRDLMVGFYRGLLGGSGRAASLLAEQRRMQADPETAHPYFWAPFIEAGDWRPLPVSRAR